jgi:hypothetical protein
MEPEDLASWLADKIQGDSRTMLAWESEVQLQGDQVLLIFPDETCTITVAKQ